MVIAEVSRVRALARLRGCLRRRDDLHPSSCLVGNGIGRVLFDYRQTGLFAFHKLLESVTQVHEYMEAVGDLLGLGSAFPCRSRVLSCAIAADNLLIAMAVIAVLDAILLGLSLVSFQRSRLILS